ncbi:MAG: DUF929 family protein [Acidimicrobiales bacterium]
MATNQANKKPAAGRPGTRPGPQGGARTGRPAGLFTWIAVGLVVVVVATLVIIKVTSGGSSSSGAQAFQPANPAVVSQVTSVPATVFNTIGVNSSAIGVAPPQVMKKLPFVTVTENGKKLPEILYVGAEYCPYCAAERWATIIALSRFGTWSGLGNMASYSGDIYPNTPTFTFARARYHSKYVAFRSVEMYTNYLNAAKTYYQPFQKLSPEENALFKKYDNCKYITGLTCQNNESFPFVNFANQVMIVGSSYTPAALDGNTRDQIAQGLTNTQDPITEAIIATANYQSASVCSIDGGQPASVCTSAGVRAAAKKLGLK